MFSLFPQTCQYGDACRFAHGENDNRDLAQLKRRAAGVCYNWSIITPHKCAALSLHIHLLSESPLTYSRFLCHCLFSLFRKESGECKFGESCRFAHEDLPEKEAKVEA